jgi:hypothetical protein
MSLPTPPGDAISAVQARPPLPLRRVPELRPEPDSALELVDSDFMVSALDSRWPAWTPGALHPQPPDLLLIDPLQRTAGPLMQALSGATGTALGRLRLLSPAGLREVARVEEIRLPAEPGLPSMVRLLHARRLPAGTPSPALERIWDRTRLAVLLAQGLPPAEADRWQAQLHALAARRAARSPRWLWLGQPDGDHLPAPSTGARHQPLPAGAGPRDVGLVWNTVLAAWSTA